MIEFILAFACALAASAFGVTQFIEGNYTFGGACVFMTILCVLITANTFQMWREEVHAKEIEDNINSRGGAP